MTARCVSASVFPVGKMPALKWLWMLQNSVVWSRLFLVHALPGRERSCSLFFASRFVQSSHRWAVWLLALHLLPVDRALVWRCLISIAGLHLVGCHQSHSTVVEIGLVVALQRLDSPVVLLWL